MQAWEVHMKVFVSSVEGGLEAERIAARRAIALLGHDPILVEDFTARSMSPQVACLTAVREADTVVLILGRRYGDKQPSGLSATHEEFKEAQGKRPILTFIQTGEPEPEQAALIREASSWERGLFREFFSDAQELHDKVARAMHHHAVASASSPLDPDALKARALAMLPTVRRDSGTPFLELAIASGPSQAILRPAQIEDEALVRALQRQALFGPPVVLDVNVGTRHGLADEALFIEQPGRHGESARIVLWPSGDIALRLPLGRNDRGMGLPVIIQETVAAKLADALAYSAWLLDHIDPTQRLTHVALAARVLGGSAFGWRTEREHAASPNSGSMMGFGREDELSTPVTLSPVHMARPALVMHAARMNEDLVALLRRRWTRG
jgi:hypothetical protein